MDNGSAILEVKCPEPEGEVVRSVRPVQLDLERFKTYWDRLKDFDVVFNDQVNDVDDFMRQFISVKDDGSLAATGLIWEVDDVGIFYLTEIRPGYEALGHFNFWDQRLRGRESLIREMMKYVFQRFGFHRVVTEVGLYAKPAMAMVERIGFVKEGRKRESVRYKGEWWDVNLYSMLDHEILEEEEE